MFRDVLIPHSIDKSVKEPVPCYLKKRERKEKISEWMWMRDQDEKKNIYKTKNGQRVVWRWEKERKFIEIGILRWSTKANSIESECLVQQSLYLLRPYVLALNSWMINDRYPKTNLCRWFRSCRLHYWRLHSLRIIGWVMKLSGKELW